MAIAWYIVPYNREPGDRPIRYCAMDDFTSQIVANGGAWSEIEILGNRAIVKVRAPQAVLDALAGVAGFRRLPKSRLDDSLADLPSNVKQAIRNEILDAGYTLAEVQARFGDDLGQYTLRDVLRFMATRRLRPRYDTETDQIILDGPPQSCRPVDALDTEVSE